MRLLYYLIYLLVVITFVKLDTEIGILGLLIAVCALSIAVLKSWLTGIVYGIINFIGSIFLWFLMLWILPRLLFSSFSAVAYCWYAAHIIGMEILYQLVTKIRKAENNKATEQ